MKHILGYKCTICQKEYEDYNNNNLFTCPSCGTKGILDVIYDYKEINKTVTSEYFSKNKDYSIWRYAPIMSVDQQYLNKTLRVGWTPLYTANKLTDLIGIKQLYIKDDTVNPTFSLKDRASAVAVVKAIEAGIDTISCSSTGNAASSLAGNAARMGIKTVIFVPERAPIGKLTQLLVYGSKVISVKGNYQQTFELSQQAINKWGWYNRNAGINPHLVEGKKTVAFELAEQLNWELPHWVSVAVGDGCSIGGVYKGFYDLYHLGLINRIPKILGVQAQGCQPFVTSFEQGRPLEPTEENTLADSIAVGVPRNPVKAENAVKNSNGNWIAVTDEEILAAMKLLGNNEGLFGEPAGVTGLAGIVKATKQGIIKSDESVAFIISGNGLKDVNSAIKAVGEPLRVEPNINELEKII